MFDTFSRTTPLLVNLRPSGQYHMEDLYEAGGIPAVLIAVWLVKSLPLDVVRWGVIVVVLYTALTLIRSAVEEQRLLTAARASVAASA